MWQTLVAFVLYGTGEGTQETGQENEQSAHETDESPNAVVYFS